jgi:hypothetical protein
MGTNKEFLTEWMIRGCFALFFSIFLRLRSSSFLFRLLFRIIVFKKLLMLINYFDNASTTKVDSRVLEAMLAYFSEIFGNA